MAVAFGPCRWRRTPARDRCDLSETDDARRPTPMWLLQSAGPAEAGGAAIRAAGAPSGCALPQSARPTLVPCGTVVVVGHRRERVTGRVPGMDRRVGMCRPGVAVRRARWAGNPVASTWPGWSTGTHSDRFTTARRWSWPVGSVTQSWTSPPPISAAGVNAHRGATSGTRSAAPSGTVPDRADRAASPVRGVGRPEPPLRGEEHRHRGHGDAVLAGQGAQQCTGGGARLR